MVKVILDALLSREDFELEQEAMGSAKKKESFSITDLKNEEFFYAALRKPDFQRETNEWSDEKIRDLIFSFLNGELIPAIILWKNTASGLSFVIDGSHRISSLVAWVNDDYGDGQITRSFFNGEIPEEQVSIADKTRRTVEKKIGTYRDYQLALKEPNAYPDIAIKARNLGSLAIQLQWVEGDATVAEASFFKINQQAVKIDRTELRLIESRKKPSAIAARSIINGGKGHKYWGKFTPKNIKLTEEFSGKIYDLLFTPKLSNPVKTLDLPMGGKGFATSSPLLLFQFVNIVNNLSDQDKKKKEEDDVTGAKTVSYLKACYKMLNRINSTHPSSLGLHPAVYFYSKNGRHKPVLFLAITQLIIELDENNRFIEFIKSRADFEELLIRYDFVITQILRKHRGSEQALPYIKEFLLTLLENLKEENVRENAIQKMFKLKEYSFLTGVKSEDNQTTSKDFSKEVKSKAFITEALESAVRCKICNSRMHKNSITIDHIKRKADGGDANIENAQLAHPYCNSTFKN